MPYLESFEGILSFILISNGIISAPFSSLLAFFILIVSKNKNKKTFFVISLSVLVFVSSVSFIFLYKADQSRKKVERNIARQKEFDNSTLDEKLFYYVNLNLLSNRSKQLKFNHLLKQGANINAIVKNDNLLSLALGRQIKKIEFYQYLIDKGFDLSKEKYPVSALYSACRVRDIPLNIIRLFLENGSNVNANIKLNNNYRTPIAGAARNGRSDLCELLFEYGANINTKSKEGATLLHTAVFSDNVDCVKFFISNGIDVNATYKGTAPLHSAIWGGNLPIITLLVKSGAIKEKIGKYSAYDLAKDRPAILKVLQ